MIDYPGLVKLINKGSLNELYDTINGKDVNEYANFMLSKSQFNLSDKEYNKIIHVMNKETRGIIDDLVIYKSEEKIKNVLSVDNESVFTMSTLRYVHNFHNNQLSHEAQFKFDKSLLYTSQGEMYNYNQIHSHLRKPDFVFNFAFGIHMHSTTLRDEINNFKSFPNFRENDFIKINKGSKSEYLLDEIYIMASDEFLTDFKFDKNSQCIKDVFRDKMFFMNYQKNIFKKFMKEISSRRKLSSANKDKLFSILVDLDIER